MIRSTAACPRFGQGKAAVLTLRGMLHGWGISRGLQFCQCVLLQRQANIVSLDIRESRVWNGFFQNPAVLPYDLGRCDVGLITSDKYFLKAVLRGVSKRKAEYF